MPIGFDDFKKMESPNAKNKIFEFLKKEKDKAFEYTELAKLLNESERTVNAYLSILKKEGKVLHKQPYWTYNREYCESADYELKEKSGNKVVPSMFRYEGDGIFMLKSDSSIMLNLNGPIKMVEAELNKHGLWSKNVVGFYYLLRKKVGLLNKRVYETENIDSLDNEAYDNRAKKLNITGETIFDTAKSNRQSHKGLNQIIEVYKIIRKGKSYQTAVYEVAQRYNVTEPTIRDACNRRLGLKKEEFVNLSKFPEDFMAMLRNKFPNRSKEIDGLLK